MSRPAPRRLAPHAYAESNIPALAAAFIGPLSIPLVFLSAGGFLIALPCGIAAILLGTIGSRGAGHHAIARLGRFTGILGTLISLIALTLFLVLRAIPG